MTTDEPSEPESGHDPRPGLSEAAAVALVFFSSAAVLVVELVALRLLAPYLGLTLETSTLVIGIALVAIAVGSWAGGHAADRIDPRRSLAPLLAVSGLAVALTPVMVRQAGNLADGAFLLGASSISIIVPGALLSAVTPMVTKLRLTTLSATGTVVGTLSGISTAGAIFGTVVTGFVLISTVPVTWIMVGLGVLLVLAAGAVVIGLRRTLSTGPSRGKMLGSAGVLAAAGLVSAVAPDGCDAETTYHCASVVADSERPGGHMLILDGLRHSYVDLNDPTHLQFEYVQALAAATDSRFEQAQPVRAHHIGGGGMTLPHYLAHTRPGTHSTVSEIDPGVVELDMERLGLVEDDDLQVRVEDGRVGLQTIGSGSVDLVVGDAFGGVSVPWHLTTREAMIEIERVLVPGGLYAVNLIDNGPLDFVRAEVATLRDTFDHVALAAPSAVLAGEEGGNVVALASGSPIDADAWAAQIAEHDLAWSVITGAELAEWVGDAPVLTDDYAPVDQLLTPYAT